MRPFGVAELGVRHYIMKKFIISLFLIALIGFTIFLFKKHSKLLHMDVTARFDGYAQSATQDYMTTIPVIRPTERYAFISDLHFLSTNWGTSMPSASIAIGSEDLKTSEGHPLLKGHYYRFSFRQKLLDSKEKYSLHITNTAEQGAAANP